MLASVLSFIAVCAVIFVIYNVAECDPRDCCVDISSEGRTRFSSRGQLGFVHRARLAVHAGEGNLMLANRVDVEIGVAFFTAVMSAMRGQPAARRAHRPRRHERPGNLKPVRSLVEPLQVAMDNGAK